MDLDRNNIYCIYGLFTGSEIINDSGRYPAITYKIIWNNAKDKYGFYNIKWEEEIQRWGIFQAVIDDEDIE